jgi:hypothetical protein
MKARWAAPALLLLALAGQADAKSFAWCQMTGGHYEAFLSGIVQIDDGPAAFRELRSGAFGNGFQDYVRRKFDPQAANFECTSQESMFFAKDYIDVMMTANAGTKFVMTDWQGNRKTAAANSVKARH